MGGTMELEQALGEKRACEAALAAQTKVLQERLKELDCLRAIARLFDRREATLEETMQSIVDVVPRAWQHAAVAQARLVLGEEEYATRGFTETPWSQTAPIVIQGERAGALTVCYQEERPDGQEGPFLSEERQLLDMVAQRIGGYVERHRSLQSLLSYQEDLRRLASVLSLSEQHERRRIAEGLHDQIGQNLALVAMRLSNAGQLCEDGKACRLIAEARALVSDVIAETRSLTFRLCPPILYELGLAAALDWVGEQFEEAYGYRVVVREHGLPVALSDDLKVTLFQAARELLVNAATHGRATTVTVDITADSDRLGVTIADNGRGFDLSLLGSHHSDEHGFGLFNIRERLRFLGGSLELESSVGKGTTARLLIPVGSRSPARGLGVSGGTR